MHSKFTNILTIISWPVFDRYERIVSNRPDLNIYLDIRKEGQIACHNKYNTLSYYQILMIVTHHICWIKISGADDILVNKIKLMSICSDVLNKNIILRKSSLKKFDPILSSTGWFTMALDAYLSLCFWKEITIKRFTNFHFA